MILDFQTVETPYGQVELWARPGVFDSPGPVMLVIHGAYQTQFDRFLSLEGRWPVSIVGAMLPGMGARPLSSPSLPTFAAAFEVAAKRLGERLSLICGESAGGLVVLAMQGGWPKLVLDPPLRSSSLWPGAVELFRRALAADPAQAEGLWTIFGVTADRWEDRDYTHLIEGPAATALVVVGRDPGAGPAPPGTPPSVVAEPERRLMRSNPNIELIEAPDAGHVILEGAPRAFAAAMDRMLGRAASSRGEPAPIRPTSGTPRIWSGR